MESFTPLAVAPPKLASNCWCSIYSDVSIYPRAFEDSAWSRRGFPGQVGDAFRRPVGDRYRTWDFFIGVNIENRAMPKIEYVFAQGIWSFPILASTV